MGKLLYGPQQRELEVDDRALAHLKVVILTKLRRGESCAFSGENDSANGSGRGTIWLSPAIPIEFFFYGSRRPALNRLWIQMLNSTAERGELHLTPEPDDPNPDSQAPLHHW
jgi:hypothetical protein